MSSSAAVRSSARWPSSTPTRCPSLLARRYAEAHGIAWPEGGLFISLGIAIPVLIAIGVAHRRQPSSRTRTRFGRYVFAIGGNPEAADLGGIKSRWIIMKVFILMGVLCGDQRGGRHPRV